MGQIIIGALLIGVAIYTEGRRASKARSSLDNFDITAFQIILVGLAILIIRGEIF